MTLTLRNSAILAARLAFLETMTSTATVIRKSSASDGAGGTADVYTEVGTYICTFAPYPITPVERERGVTILAISAWVFRFPVGTDIRETDRLMVGDREFEVTSAAGGTVQITTQALCQEIT